MRYSEILAALLGLIIQEQKGGDMTIEHDMVVLEARVAELLEHADTLKKHIEAHEFDMARLKAEGLALYCAGTNKMANRIADRVPNA